MYNTFSHYYLLPIYLAVPFKLASGVRSMIPSGCWHLQGGSPKIGGHSVGPGGAILQPPGQE